MSNDHLPTDAELSERKSISTSLLERAKARDRDAWLCLVEFYAPVIYRWSRDSGLQAADAGDIVQEVFCSVAARIDNFRRAQPGDSFRGWLWTITRNKVCDHFRRLRRGIEARGGTDALRQMSDIPDLPPSCSTTTTSACGVDRLSQRLMVLVRSKVEDHTWKAFWQTTVDGRAAVDVAGELGMTVPAVYKAKYRVLRQFRQECGDLFR